MTHKNKINREIYMNYVCNKIEWYLFKRVIGSGGAQDFWPFPSHATLRAGRRRAVGVVEVAGFVIVPDLAPRSLCLFLPSLMAHCLGLPGFTFPFFGELHACEHPSASHAGNIALYLLLFRPFAPLQRTTRPLLTSRSGFAPLPFQAQDEISLGNTQSFSVRNRRIYAA